MIRFSYIELTDFKNTANGVIHFPASGINPCDLGPGADIVGIYGQNGSGKTSVVDALSILKSFLSDDGYHKASVLDSFAPGSDSFSLAIGMECSLEGVIQDVLRYEVTFAREGDTVWVAREKISGRFTSPLPNRAKSSQRTLIEVTQPSLADVPVLAPRSSWKSLLAANAKIKTEIYVKMGLAQHEGRSLIVNYDFYRRICELALYAYRSDADYGDASPLDAIVDRLNWEAPEDAPLTFKTAYYDVLDPAIFLIPQIGYHFTYNVGIVTTLDHAACSLQLMAVNTEIDRYGFGEPPVTISLSKPAELDDVQYAGVRSSVAGISKVMGSLIPGFSIVVEDLGSRISDSGEEVRRIEFLSNRGGVKIPLRCESEGVRKLISLTTTLVQVHTRQEAFVAIDELDAGVFEYLLGELLGVIGEFGKGQLLFTAHNLRALETLGVKNIVLSTTNPKKRFIRFKGHRATNNLRDQYLRAINLGGQDEPVYASTNKYDIDEALYSALSSAGAQCQHGEVGGE